MNFTVIGQAVPVSSLDLSDLVDSIGEVGFSARLMTYLNRIAGADHCAVLGFDHGTPFKVAAVSLDGTGLAEQQIDLYLKSYWRMDPTLLPVAASDVDEPSHLRRLDPDRLPPSALRDIVYRRAHVSERLLMWYPSADPVSLSIVRSERVGKFSESDLAHLEAIAGMLLAIVRKHSSIIRGRSDFCVALESLSRIMNCIELHGGDLSRREAEVCGRILYGQSSRMIAGELDIGEETVKTYRRRAYDRLGISSQRELLAWFANRWSVGGQRLH